MRILKTNIEVDRMPVASCRLDLTVGSSSKPETVVGRKPMSASAAERYCTLRSMRVATASDIQDLIATSKAGESCRWLISTSDKDDGFAVYPGLTGYDHQEYPFACAPLSWNRAWFYVILVAVLVVIAAVFFVVKRTTGYCQGSSNYRAVLNNVSYQHEDVEPQQIEEEVEPSDPVIIGRFTVSAVPLQRDSDDDSNL